MSQHFRRSAASGTLCLGVIACTSDDDARVSFQHIRWADNGGEPCCPLARDHLLAIAVVVSGAKGHSVLQLSRDLCCQWETALALTDKSGESIDTERQVV